MSDQTTTQDFVSQEEEEQRRGGKYIIVFTNKPMPAFIGEYRVEVINDVEAFNETILQGSSGFAIDYNFLKIEEDLEFELYGIIEDKENCIFNGTIKFYTEGTLSTFTFYFDRESNILTSVEPTEERHKYLVVRDNENITHSLNRIRMYASLLKDFNPDTTQKMILSYNQVYDKYTGVVTQADCFIGTPTAVYNHIKTLNPMTLKGDLTISTLFDVRELVIDSLSENQQSISTDFKKRD